MAVSSVLLVAAGSLVAATGAQAITINDGVLFYKVGATGEVSVGDGSVSACVSTCAAVSGVGVDVSGVLTIPDHVTVAGNTYTVTEISDRAFQDVGGIFSTTIPGTIRRVGTQSFGQNSPGSGLSSVTFEPGVNLTIANLAFAGTALTHLDIPSRVTSIGATAFASMPNLETVEIGSGVTTIALCGFCQDPKLRYARFRGAQPNTYGSAITPGEVSKDSGSDYSPSERKLYYTHANASSWATPPTETDWTWTEADVPSITTPPSATSTQAGDTANFSVAATGNGTLYYQWEKNGVGIPGANSSTLAVANTALTDSGDQYDVVVSNWVGSQTSSAATLTVAPAPTPPATKAAQTMKVALAKKLKRNRGYTLPTRTAEGQPITWSTTGAGKCTIKSGKVKCSKSTGKKTVTLTARAPSNSTLLEFTQAIKRKVG